MTDYELIAQLNDAYGHPAPAEPQRLDNTDKSHELRFKLIDEEFNELLEAYQTNDTIAYADALIDLIVVIFGDLYTKSWDYPSMFNEVHRANLSKLDDDGNPIYREDGKVLKGPHYLPPDLTPYLPTQET